MKKNKSEIVIVLDRSGSMSSIKNDIEQGFKAFLEKQKLIEGEAFVTLYQFDNSHEKVFELKDIKDVTGVLIDPRGGTALIDSVCKAINEVGERLGNTPEDDRPESVIVIVLTDGEENQSREFTLEQMKEKVTHQQDVYKWNFVFLGTNIDAISVAGGYGIAAGSTLGFTKLGAMATFDSLSDSTSAYRGLMSYAFSEEERAKANKQ
jgi:uncharacterized protein with von Willebrand factor type A (vWA) domain